MNGPCSIAMFDYRRVWNIDGQTQYLFGKMMKNLTGFWGFPEFADKPKLIPNGCFAKQWPLMGEPQIIQVIGYSMLFHTGKPMVQKLQQASKEDGTVRNLEITR